MIDDAERIDVLGVGSVGVDQLALLPRFPHPDEKIPMQACHTQVGGPVPTAMRTVSALGGRAGFAGSVGGDGRAHLIEATLADSGLCFLDLHRQHSARSGISLIWIDQEQHTRTIAYCSGTLHALDETAFDAERLPWTRILHLDGRNHHLARHLIHEFRSRGSLISLDTGNFREATLELLEEADIIIMPERFPRTLIGDRPLNDLVQELSCRYPRAHFLVVTKGSEGAAAMSQGVLWEQAAFSVETVDTTGAGDVHAGALLYALIQDWDPQTVLAFAAATAALKCRQLGNSGFVSTASQVHSFLEQAAAGCDNPGESTNQT